MPVCSQVLPVVERADDGALQEIRPLHDEYRLGHVHQAAVGQHHDLVADVLGAEDGRHGGIDAGRRQEGRVIADLVDRARRLPALCPCSLERTKRESL